MREHSQMGFAPRDGQFVAEIDSEKGLEVAFSQVAAQPSRPSQRDAVVGQGSQLGRGEQPLGVLPKQTHLLVVHFARLGQ